MALVGVRSRSSRSWRRLFQLQVARRRRRTRPSRTRTSSAGSPSPTTRGVIRDAYGKVLASSRPSYNVSSCPAASCRARGPVATATASRSRDEPDSWPRLADTLRLNPDERRTLRSAHPRRLRERRRQIPVLAHADPRARGRLARHRRRAQAARRRARRRRGRRRPRSLLPVQEPRRARARLHGRDRRRDARRSSARRATRSSRVDEQQQRKPARLRRGRQRRRDRRRARVGELPARPARLGEARRRRARALSHGPGGRAPRSTSRRGRSRSRGAISASRSTSSSSKSIERAMRPHAAGAVVVVDVRTGRLLALYSKPTSIRTISRAAPGARASARRSTGSTPTRSGRCSTRR